MQGTETSRWTSLALPAAVIVLAAALAYSNSFTGPFIYDDVDHVVKNTHIRNLWPLWEATTPVEGATLRPLVSLSLAVNYALGGLDVRGYHVFNFAVHVLAALTLFGVVRRTLTSRALVERFGRAAAPLATATSAIWAVHPLQTESVTYVIQRAESLMGLFYLLSLYCFIRGVSALSRRGWWLVGAVSACALGMGCKEVMVSAPLVVLLYDRAFVAPSWRKLFGERWRFYVALAATWVIPVALLLSGPPSTSTGFHLAGLTAFDYVVTQARVITLYYLRLAVWPDPLILDHGVRPVASLFDAGMPAVVTVLLLLGTVIAWRVKPSLGFLGASFFIVLAPSSSFLPVKDIVVEHRMYLPLAAVVVAATAGGYVLGGRLLRRLVASEQDRTRLGRWMGAGLVAAVVAALAYATFVRNADYQDEARLWEHVLKERPLNPRARNNLAGVLSRQGKFEEAIVQWTEAIRLDPSYVKARNSLGNALIETGRFDEAAARFSEVLAMRPDDVQAMNGLGVALTHMGRLNDAAALFAEALELDLDDVEARDNLGKLFAVQGAYEKAAEQFAAVLRTDPNNVGVLIRLAAVRSQQGKGDEAVELLGRAIRLEPSHASAHELLARLLAGQGRMTEALAHYREASRLQPAWAQPINDLAWILATHPDAKFRDGTEAVRLAARACELTQNKDAGILDTLAAAYAEAGRFSDAVTTAEKAVALAASLGQNDAATAYRGHLESFKASSALREQPERWDAKPNAPR